MIDYRPLQMSVEPGKDQKSSELLLQDDTKQSRQNHQVQQPTRKEYQTISNIINYNGSGCGEVSITLKNNIEVLGGEQ